MIRNLDTDTLVFGEEDEFWKSLDASKRRCLERIRMIPGIILNIPHYCWSFLIYATISIIHLFLRQYIAVIVSFLSSIILIASLVFLRGDERIITAIYCLPIITCSMISLISKRGCFIIKYKISQEESEFQKLIEDFEHQNRPDADQPTGYGSKEKKQPLQGAVETVMVPRQEGEADPVTGCPHCCSTDDSPGSSSARQCTCFTVTSYSDSDSDDSDKPSQGPIVAHLHPDAINFFGPPVQVFGAGAYEVLHDLSDCACKKTNQ